MIWAKKTYDWRIRVKLVLVAYLYRFDRVNLHYKDQRSNGAHSYGVRCLASFPGYVRHDHAVYYGLEAGRKQCV